MIPNMCTIEAIRPATLRRPVPSAWEALNVSEVAVEVELPFWGTSGGLRAALDEAQMPDGTWWLHLSVSRADRLPNWDELKFAKDSFIGRNYAAVQVLPRDRDFVNLHRFCLHLWSPVEGGAL